MDSKNESKELCNEFEAASSRIHSAQTISAPPVEVDNMETKFDKGIVTIILPKKN